MDPELRSFLEAMEERTNTRMDAMEQRLTDKVNAVDAKIEAVREQAGAGLAALDAKIEAAREEAGAGLAALEAKIDEARTETRVLHEETWRKIDALGEGLSTHQREETGRIVAAREQALLDEHILPLKASNANHERRMKAVEMKAHQ